MRALALNWSLDGPLGLALGLCVVACGCLYLHAARLGATRDRRGRAWPRERSALFLGGLGLLLVDLYSGLGAQADRRLSVHMIQHMVMWLGVAPLLAAAAPLRLAFFALRRPGRQTLARWLRSRPLTWLSGPVGSVSVFSLVIVVGHLPGIYDLAAGNGYVHAVEHAAYVTSALLVWAPLLGADPLPNRAGPRGRRVCMAACMVPMVIVAAWLWASPSPVYVRASAARALSDQRVAAVIMWLGCLPALAGALVAVRGGWRRGRGGHAQRAAAQLSV